jgi:hypothetical protein
MEENEDDYTDPENEARMFHDVDDLSFASDQSDESDAEQNQNFQVSNLSLYSATVQLYGKHHNNNINGHKIY